MTFLSQFNFKGNQEQAATDPNPAIAVAAGAGAGKTLTLVARYLYLLEQGYPLRSILAITFTEKAAREMRSKIRTALAHISADSTQIHPPSSIHSSSEIDSARIGTIHSLCAEILRAHPVEARLDPAFEVLDEGLAAALQAESIDAALAWAATDPPSSGLFSGFNEIELHQILATLLGRRLDFLSQTEVPPTEAGDSEPTLKKIQGTVEKFASTLDAYLCAHLDSSPWTNALADLAAYRSASPEDKLELARQDVLARWKEVQAARVALKWEAALERLAVLRKSTSTQGKKDNWGAADIEIVRAAMVGLRQVYDEQLAFLAGNAHFSLDEQVAVFLPGLHRLLNQTLREYQRRKDGRQSLDFDDLEGLIAQLLSGHPEVRTRLQADLRAVLVDEFQDTNDRQRQIVYALTGFSPLPPGAPKGRSPFRNDVANGSGLRDGTGIDLFIVGDSKQSIYKFRGADVSVFRQVQADISFAGGLTIDLDLTFRAHKLLLENLNTMLAPILGETDNPARPYSVPFAPLRAYRQKPVRENVQAPFVEFHLGLGADAGEGRTIAAMALANRLHELRLKEGFAWGEMALLFRASTGFAVYENAFEQAGIPFVTVAGRGFYDRPEIRDLLNILAAIADPADELALVGLLRSPAFAIPDAETYQLHFSPPPSGASLGAPFGKDVAKGPGLRAALRSSSIPSHQRASAILDELHALAGRAPAAAILKQLLDLTGFRALLTNVSNGARLLGNVEKLLADAHRSRLVSLPDFLAYVQTLRDVGFREGEAPTDATSSGAVQLMTVHKAKGLEFPLVVIADAAYEHRGASDKVQLTPDGPLIDLKDGEFHPTAWQIFMRIENDREDAEDCRLLYVAATRAREKLIISGHVKRKRDGALSLAGWLEKFGLDQIQVPGDMAASQAFPVSESGLNAIIYPASAETALGAQQPASASIERSSLSVSGDGPGVISMLESISPAVSAADEKSSFRVSEPPQRVWRVVSKAKRPQAPAWVVGRLVHEALHRWRFPSDGFEAFLRPFALEAGLTDQAEIYAAIYEASRLLERFHAHPLFAEIDSAERRHEVPYFLPEGRGIIDLLYRNAVGWFIIDFKTDDVDSEEEARAVIHENGYEQQVARYAKAVAAQIGIRAKTQLVFLSVNNSLAIFDL